MKVSEREPPVNDVRTQLNEKVNKGHLKKQRRRSDENIQLVVNSKKTQQELDHLAKLS